MIFHQLPFRVSVTALAKCVLSVSIAVGTITIATTVTVSASSIDGVTVTQMAFDTTPSGPFVVDFLGGDGSIGAGIDLVNERRLALDTIPQVFDWAYWDPSGLGENPDTGGPYHAGRQVQWESKFSNPSADDMSAPNGTISPPNLDSLAAGWNLDTGNEVAQSGQGGIRITDSGRVGLRIDPGDTVDGQKFHLEMTIPTGIHAVSLFMENRTRNALATLNFPGVSQVDVGPIADTGDDEFVLQFDVTNDSGDAQVLALDWGDLANTIDDLDIRFSAAVIQVVPEPNGVVLLLLGLPLLGRRLRRRNVAMR